MSKMINLECDLPYKVDFIREKGSKSITWKISFASSRRVNVVSLTLFAPTFFLVDMVKSY